MHTCATLYSAMSNLTNDELPQHSAGTSEARRDFDDITKLVEWFEENVPFNTTDTRLNGISS